MHFHFHCTLSPSAGFDDDSISSSILKSSPDAASLSSSKAASAKEESLQREDEVFDHAEDEDIIRDYEAVHGLLPNSNNNHDQIRYSRCRLE